MKCGPGMWLCGMQVSVVGSAAEAASSAPPGGSVSVVVNEGLQLLLPLAGLFDVDKELARLAKQKTKVSRMHQKPNTSAHRLWSGVARRASSHSVNAGCHIMSWWLLTLLCVATGRMACKLFHKNYRTNPARFVKCVYRQAVSHSVRRDAHTRLLIPLTHRCTEPNSHMAECFASTSTWH